MNSLYFCAILLIFAFVAMDHGKTVITSSEHVCGNNISCYLLEEPTELILNSTNLILGNFSGFEVTKSVDIYGLYNVNVSCNGTQRVYSVFNNVSISMSGFTIRDCNVRVKVYSNVTITNMTFTGHNAGLFVSCSAVATLKQVIFRDIIVRASFSDVLVIAETETAYLQDCIFSHITHTYSAQALIGIVRVTTAVIKYCLVEDNNLINAPIVYLLHTNETEISNSYFVRNRNTVLFDDRCSESVDVNHNSRLLVDSCVFEDNTCTYPHSKTNTSATLSSPSFVGFKSNITIRNTRFTDANNEPNTILLFSCTSILSSDAIPNNFTCKCYSTTFFEECNTTVTCNNEQYCVIPTVEPTVPPTIAPTAGTLPNEIVLSGPLIIGGDLVLSGTATITPGGFLEVQGSIVIPPNTTFIIDFTGYNDTIIDDTRIEVMRSNNGTITGNVTLAPPPQKTCLSASLDRTLSSIFVIASRPDRCDITETVNVGMVLGITFGVLVLVIVGLVVIFFVPELRRAIVPHPLRKNTLKVTSVKE